LGSQAKVIPEHGRKNAMVRGIGMGERNLQASRHRQEEEEAGKGREEGTMEWTVYRRVVTVSRGEDSRAGGANGAQLFVVTAKEC